MEILSRERSRVGKGKLFDVPGGKEGNEALEGGGKMPQSCLARGGPQ